MFLRDIKYMELVFSVLFSSLVLEIKPGAWGIVSRCCFSELHSSPITNFESKSSAQLTQPLPRNLQEEEKGNISNLPIFSPVRCSIEKKKSSGL